MGHRYWSSRSGRGMRAKEAEACLDFVHLISTWRSPLDGITSLMRVFRVLSIDILSCGTKLEIPT